MELASRRSLHTVPADQWEDTGWDEVEETGKERGRPKNPKSNVTLLVLRSERYQVKRTKNCLLMTSNYTR